MSGHSKWANIKHKKAAADAKKGKIFSKLAREIMIAAQKGGDPESNIPLRAVLQKARAVNMPADNIERAIKKGTGEITAESLAEKMFEGFGPGGISVIVYALTDNHNRTTADVRLVFNRHGANLAQLGSVSRSFRRKGLILVDASQVEEDRLMEVVLDAGAEDLSREGDRFVVTSDPSTYPNVVEALARAGISTESAEITMVPEAYVPITDKALAVSVLKFIEALEDLDDVQAVYTNLDIDDRLLEEIQSEI
jgi:YebC/PmpR family DNA-binding regulatory protein